MANFFNSIPPFITNALSDPMTWSFWEWIGYIGALASIILFLKGLFNLAKSSMEKALLNIAIWGIKVNVKLADDRCRFLFKELQETMLWEKHPHRFIARVSRSLFRILLFITLSFLAILILPSPFDFLLGIPLAGTGILSLLIGGRYLTIAIDYKKYVEQEIKAIEKAVNRVEVVSINNPALEEWIGKKRETFADFKNLANNLEKLIKQDLPNNSEV